MGKDQGVDLIGSSEACRTLGNIHRSTLVRLVWAGRLKPAVKLPGKNGAYLFERNDVAALVSERAS